MRHARACFCKCTDARITTNHSHCSKPCCSLPCITACICCMREHYTCVQDKHTPSSSSHSLGMYHDSISSNQSTACCMQTSTALACCITPHPSRHSPCTTPQPTLEDIQPKRRALHPYPRHDLKLDCHQQQRFSFCTACTRRRPPVCHCCSLSLAETHTPDTPHASFERLH